MSAQVEVPLPQLLAVLPVEARPLAELLLRRQRKRRKKKVSTSIIILEGYGILTATTEKEESDEDMGFGLFD
jgi:hypothetical protein